MRAIPFLICVLITWSMTVSVQKVVAEELIERTIDIAQVQQLDFQGSGELNIHIGEQESLVITAPKSLLEQVKVDANGEVLRIKQRGKPVWETANYDIDFKLTIKKLSGLRFAGGVVARVHDPLNSEHFRLNITGAGKIDIPELNLTDYLEVRATGATDLNIGQLESKLIETHATGASTIRIAGLVKEHKANLTGAVTYLTNELGTERVSLKMSGASEAEVRAQAYLQAKLTGASSLKYLGDPKTDINSSGASSFHRVEVSRAQQ